jgi:histidinol-phosphate aminotransferase
VQALGHQDEVERRVAHTVGARRELSEGLRALGCWVAESDANFVWTHLPDPDVETDIVSGLRERGVLVRAGSSLGRAGALRVTTGTETDNRRFLGAMGDLL